MNDLKKNPEMVEIVLTLLDKQDTINSQRVWIKELSFLNNAKKLRLFQLKD